MYFSSEGFEKMIRRFALLTIGVLSLSVRAALAQQTLPPPPPVNPEDVKHGAVLCVLGVYLGAKLMGEYCYPDKDTEFLAALDKQIERIDQFIMDNAPMTKEQLDQLKQNKTFNPDLALLCRERRLFEVLKKTPSDKFEASVTALLSVPRKPVMNPCL